jgi:hypothetical protein
MAMPTQMQHITRDMVRAVLNADARATFDTHWLERRVLREHAIAFAHELLEFQSQPDPLHRFSMAFSQWFGNTFRDHVRKTSQTKEQSENLAGDIVANQGWTKIDPTQPVP